MITERTEFTKQNAPPAPGEWLYVHELRRVYYCVSPGHWKTHDHLYTRDQALAYVTQRVAQHVAGDPAQSADG